MCADHAEANDDGAITSEDGTFIDDYVFDRGAIFPPQFPQTGKDPTAALSRRSPESSPMTAVTHARSSSSPKRSTT